MCIRDRFILNLGISGKQKPEPEFSGAVSNINFSVINGPVLKGVKNPLPYSVGGRILKLWRVNNALISGNYFEIGKYMYAAVGSGRNKNWLRSKLSVNTGVEISRNTIVASTNSHGMEGIGLGGFTNALITNNTVYGVGDDPIGIHNSNNIRIFSNRIASVDGRILIKNSHNVRVYRNYIARHKSLSDGSVYRGQALIHIGYETRKGRFRSISEDIKLDENHLYYPAGGKDRRAAVYVQGTNQVEITRTIFENESTIPILAIKIMPQIFKKRHSAADESQINRFPVGDTFISQGESIGPTDMKTILIEGECQDITGQITIREMDFDVKKDCLSLPILN